MSFTKKMNYYFKGLQEKPIYLYTEEESKQYEKYIKDNIGDFKMVYHELYSPDIHLDILVIPPSEDRNYYTLVTEGLGAYQMNVPFFFENYDLNRAELVVYLPPEWNMNFESKENAWIIEQLKYIARTPIRENSWIGFGHRFSQDENATKPYADSTKFSSIILLNSIDADNEYLETNLPNKGKINFYQLFPLYKEEFAYLRENGIEALEKLFSEEDCFPIINVNRKNYCEGLVADKIVDELEEELEK